MSQKSNVQVPKFSFNAKKRQEQTRSANQQQPVQSTSSSASHHDSHHGHRNDDERSTTHSVRPGVSRKLSYFRHTSKAKGGQGYAYDERRRSSPPTPPEESHLFVVDKRGDRKNVEFGGLHRYDIPSYRPSNYDRVLGTSSNARIDFEASGDKTVVLGRTSDRRLLGRDRWLTKRFRPKESRTLRLVVPDNDLAALSPDDDFIELGSSRKRRRTSGPSEDPVSTVYYRSIEGKAKINAQIDDEDLEIESISDDENRPSPDELRAQSENAIISRNAKEKPNDLVNWLELIKHQNKMIHGHADEATLSRSERRALADVRVAIVEKALKNFSRGSAECEKLLLILQDEGSRLWETSESAARWERALEESDSSIELWLRFLDFKQTTALTFSYEACKEDYLRCLRMLAALRAKGPMPESDDVCHAQIHVLLRFSALMRDAGYDELAYGVWQVVLDHQICDSKDFADNDAAMLSLESFWESDAPRIGEQGARGLSSFLDDTSKVDYRQDGISGKTGHGGAGTLEELSVLESQQLDLLHLPATADEAPEDPFCSVLFSDLQDIVRCLLDQLPKIRLVDGFLSFLHAPPLAFHDAGHRNRWDTDPLLRNDLPISVYSKADVTNLLHDNQRTTSIYLFKNAFDGLKFRIASLGEPGKSTLIFIDRALEQLVSMFGQDETLAEYLLAFRLHFFPETVAKTAKSLLKSRPSSLRLYNAFALAEAGRGRIDKADAVWSHAIRTIPGDSDVQRSSTILLWHSWTMTKLHPSTRREALSCLLSIANNKPPAEPLVAVTTASRLKTEKYFEESFEDLVFKKQFISAVLFSECAAWFSYLINDHDLDSGLIVVERHAKRISASHPWTLELLHQTKAMLIGFHIEHGGTFKPIAIRQTLAKSIEAFPQNSTFHELYVKIGMHTRLDDRLRSSLNNANPEAFANTGLVGWCYAVDQEMQRYRRTESGSTADSVRATFARALFDPSASSVAHSPRLWKMWLIFEISTTQIADSRGSNSTPSKAKRVFLDGVRNLPWCKEWVIFGMKHFSQTGEMTADELRQLYHTMMEREIRMRGNLVTDAGVKSDI